MNAEHELADRVSTYRRGLFNAATWVQLAFERLIGFPRYVLRQAGFSNSAIESRGFRVFTVSWSAAVGLAGIGSFAIALLALLQSVVDRWEPLG